MKKENKEYEGKKEKEIKDANNNQIIETSINNKKQNKFSEEEDLDENMTWNQILNEEFDNIIINTSTEEEKESSQDSEEEKNIDIRMNSNKPENKTPKKRIRQMKKKF